MRVLLLALVLAPIAACGYEPPVQADKAKPAYAGDLESCQDSAGDTVNKRNAKTGLAWFSSPVRRWGQKRDEVRNCMAGKGYGRVP
jgi:hypothetical protein